MTFKRKLYYRRKGRGNYIIEGRRLGEKVYFVTLPKDPAKLLMLMLKGSFFSKDKTKELWLKLQGLDYKNKHEPEED